MNRPVPPPTRFAEAQKINPCQILVDLHDHAIGRPFPPTRNDALAELALAAAAVSWWARWQPAMIHAALRAGADLADISAATGLDIGEVVRRWQQWAEVQTSVVVAGHRLLDPDEVRTIRVRIAAEVGPMNPTRVARNLSTVAVAAIAAWSSWSHMVHVALRFGEHPEVAYVLPISVDGMLIVASTAMVDDQRAGRPVRWSARIAFLAGVTASVAANITAAQPTFGARIVAAWPAIALLLVVEMLSRARRTPAAPTEDVSRPDSADPLDATADTAAHADPGPRSGPTTTSSAAGTRKAPRTSGHRSRGHSNTSEAALRVRADRPDASTADIAEQLGVTERHVRRLLGSRRKSTAHNVDANPRQGH